MLEIVGRRRSTPSITRKCWLMVAQNDPWPFHADPEAATRSPFGGLIASGGYTITLMYRMSHEIVNQPDRVWAFWGALTGSSSSSSPFVPVLHERITILEKRLSSKPGRGIVKNLIEVINDQKRVVLSIEHRADGH